MLLTLVRQIRDKARWHVRQTVMLSVGGVLMAIGGGFIVAAAWIGLAPLLGVLGTALVLGAVFVGAGLIVLALRSARPAPKVDVMDARRRRMSGGSDPYRPGGNLPPVMEALLFGVDVYLRNRAHKRCRAPHVRSRDTPTDQAKESTPCAP